MKKLFDSNGLRWHLHGRHQTLDAFITLATRAGHRVICCTMRYEDPEGDEVKDLLRGKVERIFFTGRKNKTEALSAHEVFPDIWIDDAPHWIFQDAL